VCKGPYTDPVGTGIGATETCNTYPDIWPFEYRTARWDYLLHTWGRNGYIPIFDIWIGTWLMEPGTGTYVYDSCVKQALDHRNCLFVGGDPYLPLCNCNLTSATQDYIWWKELAPNWNSCSAIGVDVQLTPYAVPYDPYGLTQEAGIPHDTTSGLGFPP
jgi:hypothetical protein